ncbi:MAG: rhombotarget lipoprotein [Pseudomonadales bacterium]|nr:rhombotarget lipoprotein [Pseudomonadales bacterium]
MAINAIGRLLAFATVTWLCGCTAAFYGGGTERSTSSSMVDFLYPEGERPVVDPAMTPRLELPLRIGIAFIPSAGRWGGLEPTEARRVELLETVKATFEDVDYVENIMIVPSNYLASRGGFAALEQTSRLYDLDVFALVSWDQVVNTEDTPLSILYWTIVGGYVIPASKNTVNTMLDTAVFDMRTRKLLLRAPGFDHDTGATTAIGSEARERRMSDVSFAKAMAAMSTNLQAEVDQFGKRIKEDKSVEIAYSKNYKGASLSWGVLAVLALAALVAPGRVRRKLPAEHPGVAAGH